MNQLVVCEICDQVFIFEGKYNMGALVCNPCNQINQEMVNDYWSRSISGKGPREVKEDKPEEGKIYALTGNNGNSISSGKTWAESEVEKMA